MVANSLISHGVLSLPMSHHPGTTVEHSGSPFHWVNGDGLSLRLQAFLTVRNAEDEVALVQLDKPPGHWWLPAETLRPNEPVHEAGKRVSETWFGVDLDPELAEVINFSAEEEGEPWYHLFVFEARGELEDFDLPGDTVEVRFLEPGEEIEPFAMGHAEVWPKLGEAAKRV